MQKRGPSQEVTFQDTTKKSSDFLVILKATKKNQEAVSHEPSWNYSTNGQFTDHSSKKH